MRRLVGNVSALVGAALLLAGAAALRLAERLGVDVDAELEAVAAEHRGRR